MEIKYYFAIPLLISLVFLSLIYGVNYFFEYKDNKYCDLSREVDRHIIELHPSYYEMEEYAKQYVDGDKVISGDIVGKLMGGSKNSLKGEYLDYVCWYEFTVLKGDIIEYVTIQHVFVVNKVLEEDNLIKWRKEK